MLNTRTLIFLIAIGLSLSLGFTVHAKTPDGQTPAVEDVCDGLAGAAYGLCNAFCEAMDCDSDTPKASEKACNKVQANFEKKTGEVPPCLFVDPCAELVDGNPDNECPCIYSDVPMTDACWIQSENDQQFFSPLGMDGDTCDILTGTQQFRIIRMEARQFMGGFSCFINFFAFDPCMGPETTLIENISEAQFLTCLCRIEQYADELEEVSGFDIVNGDPPFNCSPCGNGILDQAEQCDDGNTVPGDGCSGDCSFVEPGYECPAPGEPCMEVCGDGILTPQEQCDDGNTDPGDGCSGDCSSVEPGYECPAPGEPCMEVCGDGILTSQETCDDGNTDSGDGCSGDCSSVEPGFQCPIPGEPCFEDNP